MSIAEVISAVGTGGAVGLTLALTGAGGGILVVLCLVFTLHVSSAEAAPSGLRSLVFWCGPLCRCTPQSR